MATRPMVASQAGEHLPVIKYNSYLAGTAFALLLSAHIAMEMLAAYPASQHLWYVNIVFAREVRPLLQHMDVFAGGRSMVTIVSLGGLALLCIASALANMRLLAAVNCHIALIMFIFVAARSYGRTYPYGVDTHDTLAALAARLSGVQIGMAVLLMALAVVCVLTHVEFLGRAGKLRRSVGSANARAAVRDGAAALPEVALSRMLKMLRRPFITGLRPSSG